jgi:ATP-dependent helicase/nuclease subunit B
MALNLFTLPAHVPFLDALAAGWLDRAGASLAGAPVAGAPVADAPLADAPRAINHLAINHLAIDPLAIASGVILLPTRRSARGLAEAFLRVSDGRPLLLPRITALGALDEAPLALAGALDLPPAVEEMQRLAALTSLILAMRGDGGAPTSADRAWRLAVELAALMDEAERAEIDLRRTLPDAADPAFAEHWAKTLEFLRIVTEAWPAWLADNGLMNPAERQVALLDAQARAWEEAPPADPVLIAGTTAGIPAVARLLKVVARLPRGQVVLPALDLGMTEAAWAAIEDSHPQAGLARLLADLGATRDDVRPWGGGARSGPGGVPPSPGTESPHPAFPDPAPLDPAPPNPASLCSAPSGPRAEPEKGGHESRFATLSHALLPARALGAWQRATPVGLAGLTRLAAADQQEEAEAIALILRDALETPGTRAALVTPDRSLAARVTAALTRHGIVADDSAGEKLTETPQAVFLRLLARAVAEGFAPVPLLALLKHPLAATGRDPAASRSDARLLEVACLRGPRPARGLAGLRIAVERAGNPRLGEFLTRLERCLEPAIRIETAARSTLADALAAIIDAAERLAATDPSPDSSAQSTSGAERLWAGEEGAALAERLAAVLAVAPMLPEQRRGVLPGFLDAVLDGAVVRGRRAVRGRDGLEHPRVHIWGLLEARLQSVDRLILGGLAEGVWPPQTDPGPWLSRPMRQRVGLPSPEWLVGQAAHDFLAAACAAPEVVLSCPTRRDGAPAVPARWLTRLEAFLAGQGHDGLPVHPAAGWARAVDLPADGPRAVKPPRPCPPVALRPRALGVTAIETWLRDPYAIHARYILRLEKLKPLDEETDAADYGELVHKALHRFLQEIGSAWPPGSAARLRRIMDVTLGSEGLRPALIAWWTPRLGRIAEWVAAREINRRSITPPSMVSSEVRGEITLARPGGAFRLRGRADRIERRADGKLTILDYKTGTIPSRQAVERGFASQLLLEAAMAETGGFGEALRGETAELLYWRLTGGAQPGEETTLFQRKGDDLAAEIHKARAALEGLIDAYDDGRPYLSHPNAAWAPRFADYAQLARVAEWSAAGEDGS